MSTKVTCSECGTEQPTKWAERSADHPCPACGSLRKNVELQFEDKLTAERHDSVRGKVKDARFPSKKNPRVDFFSGDDLRKSDGKWMQKERVIDKDKDHYKEVVVDPETGQVIHRTEEPLSAHMGHGSAKFKKNDLA